MPLTDAEKGSHVQHKLDDKFEENRACELGVSQLRLEQNRKKITRFSPYLSHIFYITIRIVTESEKSLFDLKQSDRRE
jgi:hypothetical protein